MRSTASQICGTFMLHLPQQRNNRGRGMLEHRSRITPSPLAGEGWDGGAEAETDSLSHAWPHPHPCPPPSRGRESARTGSPSAYLTDVLDLDYIHVNPFFHSPAL